ncbi:MAG: hypothetical protein Kow0022_16770 [Phycisphaerales bacterium]
MTDQSPEHDPMLEAARRQAEAARRRARKRGPTDPEQIGPYNIVARLGSGGMGIVFLAEHQQSGRVAALKVLRPGLESASAGRRFAQEIEILRRLDHPGIARFFEAGTTLLGGVERAFYAMEYVPGRHIIRHCEINNLPTERRLELFARVCEAMAHAHAHGVLHRDIKPHNILVELPAAPKIMDFGVARLARSDKTTMHTQIGQVLGTVQYMSPEQVQGRHDELDERSDVYALGVVLYELLCGQLPFSYDPGDTAGFLRALREGIPARPSEVNPSLSESVCRVILTAMARERSQRYPSAEAMREDILRAARGEPSLGVAHATDPAGKPRRKVSGLSRLLRLGGFSDAARG